MGCDSYCLSFYITFFLNLIVSLFLYPSLSFFLSLGSFTLSGGVHARTRVPRVRTRSASCARAADEGTFASLGQCTLRARARVYMKVAARPSRGSTTFDASRDKSGRETHGGDRNGHVKKRIAPPLLLI